MSGLIKKYACGIRRKIRDFLADERGDSNIIAVILIIIIVIALAVIFRDQLFGIVDKLFGKINNSIDEI